MDTRLIDEEHCDLYVAKFCRRERHEMPENATAIEDTWRVHVTAENDVCVVGGRLLGGEASCIVVLHVRAATMNYINRNSLNIYWFE